jgi:predicted outer membrane repeat protein
MKTLLALIGIVAVLLGLLFVGQGSGYIPWPASSFMINQSKWMYYGGAIAAAGLIVFAWSRR